MTVKELIIELEKFPSDYPVKIDTEGCPLSIDHIVKEYDDSDQDIEAEKMFFVNIVSI